MLLKDQLCSWSNIKAGIPQSCILFIIGPFLFLIYVNNLSDGLTTNARPFPADDVLLFLAVDNMNLSVTNLCSDLSIVNAWANQWKMSFNLDLKKQG